MTPNEEKRFTMAAAAYVALIAGLVLLTWALGARSAHADQTPEAACRAYSWKNRGRAPQGYIDGVKLVYKKLYCQWVSPAATDAGQIGSKLTTDAKDALVHYKSKIEAQGVTLDAGLDRLRATVALLIGLGMRESSGDYSCGYDSSAGAETPSEAEAGAWQQSYNLQSANSFLPKVYAEYQANQSACLLSAFKVGAGKKNQSIVGTGAGADFQRFLKSCPAFAAEDAAVGLRFLRNHWGPINRLEAEFNRSCYDMLKLVESDAGCQ